MRRWFAIAGLGVFYFGARLFSRGMRFLPLSRPGRIESIMVIGTFHNPNWFRSHITPLTRSGLARVYLVCDEPVDELDGLTYCCPPRILQRLATRAGAKFIWAIVNGIRYRPDLYMGYHIVPAGVMALVLARAFRCFASYQMTGGPTEVEGGGYAAENPILTSLGRPSAMIEHQARRLIGEFDSVIVRGQGSRRYAAAFVPSARLEIVTGSVATERIRLASQRDIDLLFVGRLTPCKRPEVFVDIVATLRERHPDIQACLVGDGEMLDRLRQRVVDLGLAGHVRFTGKVSNVYDYLARARVFVITSRSEGLSIALMEAMCAGVVPVVYDIGDLSDLVHHGRNGLVVEANDRDGMVEAIAGVLDDAACRESLATRAIEEARSRCDTRAVAGHWRRHFASLTRQ